MANFSKFARPRVLLLAQLLSCATPTAAFWRLLCRGQVGVARIDPIADIGMISDHAHAIHGAQNFNFDSTGASLMESSCSSCAVTQDRSAYWTPPLYFLDDNGTYTLVPQVGGMTVYYFNNNSPEADNTNVTAFPPNFRMISGDTRRRNFTVPTQTPFIMDEPFNVTDQSQWGPAEMNQLALSQMALGFNCLHQNPPRDEGAREYNYLRPKSYIDANCTDGVRFEVMFPSCWDGVNFDSPDHKSHVQFPDLVQEGYCNQTTHPHRIPALFYETIFDTPLFKNLSGSFVVANGDPTGFGYHGDFLSGWNQNFLQQAIHECTNKDGGEEDCPLFTIRDDLGVNCTGTIPAPLKSEDVHGPMSTLPGNKLVQSGPGYADQPRATPLSIGLTGSLPSSSSAAADTAISTSTCANTSSTSLPSITVAPKISTAPGNLFSTSTYTTNNLVVEVVIVESYVTVTETATDLAKRHHGSHHLYHRHH